MRYLPFYAEAFQVLEIFQQIFSRVVLTFNVPGFRSSFRNIAVAVSFRAFAQTVSFSLSLFDHHFFDTGDKD